MGVQRAAAVVNPAAGGGSAGRRWPKIEARLREAGIAVVSYIRVAGSRHGTGDRGRRRTVRRHPGGGR